MSKLISLAVTLFLFFSSGGICLAAGDSFTQKDRELLVRLDERLNQIDKRFEQIDKRFEQIDKRFEQVDKRFDQVDKRFAELRDDMNKRFAEQISLMRAIIGAFAAIVAVTIGFALWDRRTMIRPFEDRVRKIEDDIMSDKKRLRDLLKALREYAKKDRELAQILKSFSLL